MNTLSNLPMTPLNETMMILVTASAAAVTRHGHVAVGGALGHVGASRPLDPSPDALAARVSRWLVSDVDK